MLTKKRYYKSDKQRNVFMNQIHRHGGPPALRLSAAARCGRSTSSLFCRLWWHSHLMLVTSAHSLDAWPVQTGVCVGSVCQLHAAGVWPRRKEAARGQTLCQLIVQRVGRAGGRVACLGAKGSPRPTLFWHFGKGKRQNEMIQFKLV